MILLVVNKSLSSFSYQRQYTEMATSSQINSKTLFMLSMWNLCKAITQKKIQQHRWAETKILCKAQSEIGHCCKKWALYRLHYRLPCRINVEYMYTCLHIKKCLSCKCSSYSSDTFSCWNKCVVIYQFLKTYWFALSF